MANTLRFKRGLASGIPTALAGEPLFTTDTFDLYIGNGTTNTRFQKYIASGATTQILRGDGSLYTFPLAISSPTNGQVLKYNGTSWVNDSDAGITGSGANGRVAFWTGTNTQSSNSNLFWDNTNVRLGIRTATPVATLEVSYLVGGSGLSSLLSNPMFAITNPANYGYPVGIVFRTPMTNGGAITNIGSIWCEWQSDNNTFLGFATNTSGTVSEKMRLFATGNFGINTGATDSGQRLQVSGTALITGATSVTNTITATLNNGSVFNARSGSASGYAYYSVGRTSEEGVWGVAGASNQFFIGAVAGDMFIGANNNKLFFGTNASTAAPYMTINAGNVLIGSTTDSGEKLQVTGTMKVTGASSFGGNMTLSFGQNATIKMRVQNTTAGTASYSVFEAANNTGAICQFGKGSTSATPFSILNATDTFIYNETSGDIAILNYFNFGNIKFAAGGSSTTQMLLNASGNLGLGVTPSAWASVNAFQLGYVGSLASRSGGSGVYLSSNVYFIGDPGANGANARYIQTTTAGSYAVVGNNHYWFTAPSGTLNTAITLTQAMTLDASGNLGIGTASPSGKLQVKGAVHIERSVAADFSIIDNEGNLNLKAATGGGGGNFNIVLHTAGSERVRLFGATGNFGIGTGASDSGERLQVTGTAKITDSATFTKTYTNSSDLGVIVSSTVPGINLRSTSNGRTSFIQNYNANGMSSIIVGAGTNNPSIALMHFNSNDNSVIVGSWSGTSSGDKLQVEGSARISGNLTVDTDTLFVDATANEVGIGTTTPTAFLDVRASTTGAASLRLRSGAAPTTLNDGDIWFDGTDLKMRIGGVTKTFTLT